MKTLTIAGLIVLSTVCSTAQPNIVVEEIDLSEVSEGTKLPRLKDTVNPGNPVVTKINNLILERFEIESFNPKEIREFSWSGVRFHSQVKSNIAFINYSGEYMGAYPSPVEEELFFDLQTGEPLKNVDLPFHSLFSLDGYFAFLNKHWLTGVKGAFKEAVACAEAEPECSYYDISEYKVEKSKLLVKLESECYPHAAMSCSPGFSVSVPVDSINAYLATAGAKILLHDRYTDLKGVDKYLYNSSVWKEIPNNMYIFGLIDNKYPVSIAVTIAKSGAIQGYYYYDKRKQKIKLTGQLQYGLMQMVETVNGQSTGNFSLRWSDNYVTNDLAVFDTNGEMKYLSGEWNSPDGKKILKITFNEVKHIALPHE